MDTDLHPWDLQIWSQWQTLLKERRLHHALLLCAPKGSGKLALGATLAKTLLCTSQGIGEMNNAFATEPCGQCHSCHLFDADTHPDFHWLKPEAQGKRIGVDIIRKGVQYAWETSALGGRRVILIQDADKMGEAASNALLKTLEEPPLQCHFILLAGSMGTMLPTVVSRCNKWKPKLPDTALVKQWVEAQLMQTVSLQAILLNRGAPLAAKAFVENGNMLKHKNIVAAFSQYILMKQGLFSLTDLIIKAEGEGLHWLSFLLLDVMKIQEGTQEGIIHCDALDLLFDIAKKAPKNNVREQLFKLNKLSAQLEKNTGLNRELLISRWLSDFQ